MPSSLGRIPSTDEQGVRMAPRILVTGTSTFFATRLIHELGRQGAEITAADSLLFSAGKASKFTSRRLRLPRLTSEPGKYLDAVRRELRSRDYDLLLPTFEEGLLFAEYQDELRELTNLFLPPFETMNRLHHKPTLHEVCQELSIPSPPTIVVDDEEDLAHAASQLQYPLVLKLPASNNSVGRTYCDNWESLRVNFQLLARMQQNQGNELPFLQQKIDGDLIFTLCFCNSGQKLGEVIYRTLRTFPLQGGTAAHRESIEHAEISRITSKLCLATNWTGFLGLDFIVDRRTGTPYLIDANVRANPAVHLGYLSGIDWSGFLLDMLAGRQPTPVISKFGINSQTMLLDGGCIFEILFRSGDSLKTRAIKIRNMFKPPWRVDSRDDLLSVGEYKSFATLLGHGIYCLINSVLTGRQVGQLLLDNANYDPASAAAYRHEIAASRPAILPPLRKAG